MKPWLQIIFSAGSSLLAWDTVVSVSTYLVLPDVLPCPSDCLLLPLQTLAMCPISQHLVCLPPLRSSSWSVIVDSCSSALWSQNVCSLSSPEGWLVFVALKCWLIMKVTAVFSNTSGGGHMRSDGRAFFVSSVGAFSEFRKPRATSWCRNLLDYVGTLMAVKKRPLLFCQKLKRGDTY